MIYSPAARAFKIGPPPCMTTCPLHSTSLLLATEELLYKHFALLSQSILLLTKLLQIYFHVRRQSWLSRRLKSSILVCPMEKLHRLLLLEHISLVTRGNPWPVCPLQRCLQYLVPDTITVKVGCSSTHAHCVLWRRWSPAKWFILYRWLVLGQIEPLLPYSAMWLQACIRFMCEQVLYMCVCMLVMYLFP